MDYKIHHPKTPFDWSVSLRRYRVPKSFGYCRPALKPSAPSSLA